MSPCEFFQGGSGNVTVIVCSARGRQKTCEVYWNDGRRCGKPAGGQCDGPKPGGKTCDRHICKEHALHVGKNRDLCPNCAAKREPEPRRDPATMPKRLRRPS